MGPWTILSRTLFGAVGYLWSREALFDRFLPYLDSGWWQEGGVIPNVDSDDNSTFASHSSIPASPDPWRENLGFSLNHCWFGQPALPGRMYVKYFEIKLPKPAAVRMHITDISPFSSLGMFLYHLPFWAPVLNNQMLMTRTELKSSIKPRCGISQDSNISSIGQFGPRPGW